MGTFDPVILPEGTVRYVGGVRGSDERGHDAFAVDLGNGELFGEVQGSFHADGNTYDVLISSFGHAKEDYVDDMTGMKVLPRRDIEPTRRVIVGWVEAVMRTPNDKNRPPVFFSGRYSGRIVFADGWARADR